MCKRRDPGPRRALAAAALALAVASRARADDAAPVGYTTVVRAPGGPPQPVSAAVDGEEARRLPGTGGDPPLAAQDLPGVARPAPGATGLAVWGTAPAETRVLYDGIEIPALYHFGGFRSTVGSELPGRIEVVPGAFSAEYGRAVGGLVRVESRAPPASGTHLALDASLLDASLALRAAPSRRLRVAASVRASYLDQTYGRAAPASATALYPIPRYADAQAEAALAVGPGAALRALVLTSLDGVRRNLGGAALGVPDRFEDRGLAWWRAGLAYTERGDDDGLAATLYAGGDRATLDQRFGAAPASQAVASLDLGLRARYRVELAPGLCLTLGLDGLVQRAEVRRAGSLTVPAREGDLTYFGQPPGGDVNADAWTAAVGDLGPFLLASLGRGPWTLTPGLRADAFPVDGSRLLPPVGATPRVGYARVDWVLDPRLSLAVAPRPGLVLTAAAGRTHQPTDPADLGAVFGSPRLGPARALHAALSIWKRLGEHTSVEATGFYRRLDDLPVRSPLPAPALAQTLVSDGRGRSFGASVLVRRELARGTLAWLTYTLGRSERWSPGGPARPLDFDQTHVLTAVASHQRGGWTLGARARYATGMPRTPIVGSFFDARDGAYQPIFGEQNGTRLPAFLELDARLDRALTVGRVTATLFLDVQNVTARRNPEEVVYTQDFTSSGYLTGTPLLALVGVRIES
jgi:outer membrane receptor protein involved in Fe transport